MYLQHDLLAVTGGLAVTLPHKTENLFLCYCVNYKFRWLSSEQRHRFKKYLKAPHCTKRYVGFLCSKAAVGWLLSFLHCELGTKWRVTKKIVSIFLSKGTVTCSTYHMQLGSNLWQMCTYVRVRTMLVFEKWNAVFSSKGQSPIHKSRFTDRLEIVFFFPSQVLRAVIEPGGGWIIGCGLYNLPLPEQVLRYPQVVAI